MKTTEPIDIENAKITDKKNYLFSSTLVANGSAIGVVISTGMQTELGIIQKTMDEIKQEDTPLQKRLDEFGETLARTIGVICILVWVMNFRNFSDEAHGGFISGALYYFKVAVALAVAAIPEGLPAVITTCLALGTRRMAREKAIVRKLPSVETLGCTTVICSDKTGTLTTNEMVVKDFFYFGNSATDYLHSEVSGNSYQPEGTISNLKDGQIYQSKSLRLFVECMSLNNDAKLIKSEGKITRSGLPTEAALKVLVEKFARYDQVRLDGSLAEAYGAYLTQGYKKLATLEFSRDRKSMSVLCKDQKTGKNVMFIKGAPDYLVKSAKNVMLSNGDIVPLNDNAKKDLLERINLMAKRGLRTLAIAYKDNAGPLSDYNGPNHPAHALLANIEGYSKLESEPTILGVVGIQDPPRPEVEFISIFLIK